MTYYAVTSSNIEKLGYDRDTFELEVWFHSGAEYLYKGVPFNVFGEFLYAESVGSFFHANIKGKYEFIRL